MQHKVGDLLYNEIFERLGYISAILENDSYSVVWLNKTNSDYDPLPLFETNYSWIGIEKFKKGLKEKMWEFDEGDGNNADNTKI
jgi:hypothetical protein